MPYYDVIIYHNPECGTSRNALAMIRKAGIEPHVIEYLKTPPARALLVRLIAHTYQSAAGGHGARRQAVPAVRACAGYSAVAAGFMTSRRRTGSTSSTQETTAWRRR